MQRLCRAGIQAPRGVVRHCGEPALFPFKLRRRSLTCWYCAKHYEQTALFYAVHDVDEPQQTDPDCELRS